MSMTKKDYELIADTLVNAGTWYSDGTPEPIYKNIVEAFAETLAKDNPKFDRKRFLQACGVTN